MKYACDICGRPVSIAKAFIFEEVYYSLDGSPNYSTHANCPTCQELLEEKEK
jgi:hypothetical protein